ncbi:MAG: DUF4386 domain-containing protein [Alphaproteobacteria bacterium]|nr:DUF4386 domain-containing protein [Alphaproteobacteria bacterium]
MNPVLYARIAGLAYLAIFILAIGANFGVLEGMLVRGDAAATLANITAHETGFRLAIAALFLVLFADLIVAWAFYVLFSPLAPKLTGLTMLFRVAYTISHIPFVVLLVIALRAATSDASLFAAPDVAAYELIRAHSAGFTYTLLFFGVHLVLLGVLALKTRGLPAILAVLITLAGVGYLLDGFGILLVPDLFAAIPLLGVLVVIVPALLGEGLLTLYLLIRGVDARRWSEAPVSS